MNRSHPVLISLLAAAGLAGLAGLATAQDARKVDRAVNGPARSVNRANIRPRNVLHANFDANLSPLPGGVNPVAPQLGFRSRNYLITNSVVGGRGFRGTVGYNAESDFRIDGESGYGETLGSNDLYQFRAGSAWSDVTLLNYGNTYNRLRFGQNIGLLEYRRSGGGTSLGSMPDSGQIRLSSMQHVARVAQLDNFAFESSVVSSSFRARKPIGIGTLAGAAPEDPDRTVTVSSINGMNAIPTDQDYRVIGVNGWDLARLRDDSRTGRLTQNPGTRFQLNLLDRLADSRIESTLNDTRSSATPLNSRVPGLEGPGYRDILESIAKRYSNATTGSTEEAVDPARLTELEDDLEALRRRMAGGADENPIADEPIEPMPEGGSVEPITRDFDIATVLRHGERVKSFITDGETRFNELVRAGETNLRGGRYFRAEADFKRALRFEPGHPLPTVGLAHAQIGAGLYLPASNTLRSLFIYQPEMIGAQYESGLVPNRPRLNRAVTELQGRLHEQGTREAFGLLLAYIGRLMDEPALVEQGIDVLRDATPDSTAFANVLEQIWLKSNAPAEQP